MKGLFDSYKGVVEGREDLKNNNPGMDFVKTKDIQDRVP